MNRIKPLFIFVAIFLCACSSNDDEPQPDIRLSDISGVWVEYAYMCDDGYFVDISNTDTKTYYEFDIPNKFTRYSIDKDGIKDIETQGEWTFNVERGGWHTSMSRADGILKSSSRSCHLKMGKKWRDWTSKEEPKILHPL